MPRHKRNRRYHYDKANRVKYLLDEYGDPYYYLDEQDKTVNVSMSIPRSLKEVVDRQRGDVPFARFVRKALEKYCNVKQVWK